MRRGLKILLVISALFSLASGMFGPIYAIFVEEIGGDLLTAGEAYATFSIATGVIIFMIGRWEDHVKHQEKLVVIGYALNALAFLGYILISSPIHLFIIQILLGVSASISTPAYDGLYSRWLDKGKYASEWGTWESMYYIITGIAAIIGGYLASLYGFQFIFYIMLSISIFGVAASTLLLKGNNEKR